MPLLGENTYKGLMEYPKIRYEMGFAIDGNAIPDPMVFTGAESDLDTEGERDVTGYLHRNMVATKYPLKLEYHNIPWDLIMEITANFRKAEQGTTQHIEEREKKDKFTFTFPSPFIGRRQTIEAYCGDLEFECVWAPTNAIYLGNLKFSVIQY